MSIININRPPRTDSDSFSSALKSIDKWIQKEFCDSSTKILGDFNLKKVSDWNESIISNLKKAILTEKIVTKCHLRTKFSQC